MRTRLWLPALGIVGLSVVPVILLLDQPAAHACAALPPALQAGARAVSILASLPVALGVAGVMVALYFIRRRTGSAGRHLLSVPAAAISAWLLTMLLKVVFGRYRPELFLTQGLYGFSFFKAGYWFNSFPSGHAATAFGFLAAIGNVRPRWRWPLLALATVIAASRVVMCAHFPADVMAGAVVGSGCALLFTRIIAGPRTNRQED